MNKKESKMNITDEVSLNTIDYLKNKLKGIHNAYNAREYLEGLVDHILACEIDCHFGYSLARDILRLVSKKYESFERVAYSIKVDSRLIENDLRLISGYRNMLDKFDLDNIKKDIELAIKHRNIYTKDYCPDITDKFKQYSDMLSLNDIIFDNVESRSLFEYDPIELTDEYLAVIDEVDRIVDEHETPFMLGSCHIIWGIKKRELSKRGIEWHSPAEMNPYIMFD